MAAGQTTAKLRFPFTCKNLFHYIFFSRFSGSTFGFRPPYLRLQRVMCVCVVFPFLAVVFVVSVHTAKNEKQKQKTDF